MQQRENNTKLEGKVLQLSKVLETEREKICLNLKVNNQFQNHKISKKNIENHEKKILKKKIKKIILKNLFKKEKLEDIHQKLATAKDKIRVLEDCEKQQKNSIETLHSENNELRQENQELLSTLNQFNEKAVIEDLNSEALFAEGDLKSSSEDSEDSAQQNKVVYRSEFIIGGPRIQFPPPVPVKSENLVLSRKEKASTNLRAQSMKVTPSVPISRSSSYEDPSSSPESDAPALSSSLPSSSPNASPSLPRDSSGEHYPLPNSPPNPSRLLTIPVNPSSPTRPADGPTSPTHRNPPSNSLPISQSPSSPHPNTPPSRGLAPTRAGRLSHKAQPTNHPNTPPKIPPPSNPNAGPPPHNLQSQLANLPNAQPTKRRNSKGLGSSQPIPSQYRVCPPSSGNTNSPTMGNVHPGTPDRQSQRVNLGQLRQNFNQTKKPQNVAPVSHNGSAVNDSSKAVPPQQSPKNKFTTGFIKGPENNNTGTQEQPPSLEHPSSPVAGRKQGLTTLPPASPDAQVTGRQFANTHLPQLPRERLSVSNKLNQRPKPPMRMQQFRKREELEQIELYDSNSPDGTNVDKSNVDNDIVESTEVILL